MTEQAIQLFTTFGIGVVLTLVVGFYCILTSRNLVRTLIGVEVLTKAVTLLLIVVGHVTNQMATAQALVITLIIIEVAVIVVAVGIVLSVHRATDTVDSKVVQELKG